MMFTQVSATCAKVVLMLMCVGLGVNGDRREFNVKLPACEVFSDHDGKVNLGFTIKKAPKWDGTEMWIVDEVVEKSSAQKQNVCSGDVLVRMGECEASNLPKDDIMTRLPKRRFVIETQLLLTFAKRCEFNVKLEFTDIAENVGFTVKKATEWDGTRVWIVDEVAKKSSAEKQNVESGDVVVLIGKSKVSITDDIMKLLKPSYIGNIKTTPKGLISSVNVTFTKRSKYKLGEAVEFEHKDNGVVHWIPGTVVEGKESEDKYCCVKPVGDYVGDLFSYYSFFDFQSCLRRRYVVGEAVEVTHFIWWLPDTVTNHSNDQYGVLFFADKEFENIRRPLPEGWKEIDSSKEGRDRYQHQTTKDIRVGVANRPVAPFFAELPEPESEG